VAWLPVIHVHLTYRSQVAGYPLKSPDIPLIFKSQFRAKTNFLSFFRTQNLTTSLLNQTSRPLAPSPQPANSSTTLSTLRISLLSSK
jgi:hypothetical protein